MVQPYKNKKEFMQKSPPRSQRAIGVDQPAVYQILIQGRLDQSWSAHFDGMTMKIESSLDGPAITILKGTVTDQSSLHGMLNAIHNLGLLLLKVECLSFFQPNLEESK